MNSKYRENFVSNPASKGIDLPEFGIVPYIVHEMLQIAQWFYLFFFSNKFINNCRKTLEVNFQPFAANFCAAV